MVIFPGIRCRSENCGDLMLQVMALFVTNHRSVNEKWK